MRHIQLAYGILIVSIISLFVTTCDKPTSSGIEDTIELFAGLEAISEASNTTMIVNKGKKDSDSYFQVEISGLETNGLLRSGSHGAWCLEWRKPMRSNNDEHKGVKWYSSIGNPKWKPLNYFFSIKGELEAADPSLTYREFQAVVWSLAGYMGIAPEFDLATLPDSELPGDLRTNGQANFSKQKVLAIVDRVKSEYNSPTKFKTSEEDGCIVGETEDDQQNVCVPTEPEIIVETITAGGEHSCGLDSEGNAYCWGNNDFGQLGDGTMTTRLIPVPVNMPEGVSFTAVSAGSAHTVALSSTGTAWAWGSNRFRQLGNDGTDDSNIPVAVSMPDGVSFSKVSVGYNHSLALVSSGKAWAWGANTFGQLGDGTTTTRPSPVAVNIPEDLSFTTINGGLFHTVAIGSNGDAWAWGRNNLGQLGNGSTEDSNTPVSVDMSNGISFTDISGGELYTLALNSTGEAWAWGRNQVGQLGNGTWDDSTIPVAVSMHGVVSFSAVSAGKDHALALTSTGEVWAWGWNGRGQLGTGTTESKNTPELANMPDGVSFTTIGAGAHSLALASSGTAWAWGRNLEGQLGDGTTDNRSTPVEVLFPLP